MLIFLKILTITVIIILSLFALTLVLLLVLLLLPWRYEVNGSVKGKDIRGFLEGGSFLRLVYFGARMGIGAEDRIFVRLLGFKILEITEKDRVPDEETDDSSLPETVSQEKDKPEENIPDDAVSGMNASGFFETKQEDRKTEPASWANMDPKEQEPEMKTKIPAETDAKGGEAAKKRETRRERSLRYRYLLSEKAKKLSGKLKNFLETLKESFGRRKELKEFLQNEENRKLIALVFTELKKDLIRILPGEGEGEVKFGVGDPYYTGKILEVLGLLYPFYGKVIRVCPLFEETKFEARAEAKGRFYLIALLVSFFRLYWNQKLKQMIREFMRKFKHERSERS